MNIETANRLVELRKQHGYSQEGLAEQLGLSRQAVSKWERAEASPDTDNLIALAQLYRISLDELLGNAAPVPPYQQELSIPEKPVNPLARHGFPLWFTALVLVAGLLAAALVISFFWSKMAALYPILCVILYLCSGFYFHKWHPTWMIFLTIPIFYILFG